MSFCELEPLLDLISAKTWQRLHNWMDIGKALKSNRIDVAMWTKYTRLYCPSRLIQCDEIYAMLAPGNFTARTIAWFARRDNPDKFNEWHEQWIADASDTDKITEVVHRIMWPDLFFVEHAWYIYRNGNFERLFIANFDVLIYFEVPKAIKRSRYMNLWRAAEILQKWHDPFLRIKVEKELRVCCHTKDVFNDNPRLLRMNNHILDMRLGEPVLRDIKPEDFVTEGSELDISGSAIDARLVDITQEWLEQILPDKDAVDEFLELGFHILRGEQASSTWAGSKQTIRTLQQIFSIILGPARVCTRVNPFIKTKATLFFLTEPQLFPPNGVITITTDKTQADWIFHTADFQPDPAELAQGLLWLI